MTATKTNGPPPGRADEQAPVLVLLHGGGPGVDALGNWATVRPALSASFRCLAPDLLGFGTQVTTGEADGGTPLGPRAWARARARQILSLLDRQGLRRVHLLGNSAAGGAAALALMAEAPERVDRAVLMGGAGTGPPPARVPFYEEPTAESMRATLARLVADETPHRDLLDELAPRRRPGQGQRRADLDQSGPAHERQGALLLRAQPQRVPPGDRLRGHRGRRGLGAARLRRLGRVGPPPRRGQPLRLTRLLTATAGATRAGKGAERPLQAPSATLRPPHPSHHASDGRPSARALRPARGDRRVSGRHRPRRTHDVQELLFGQGRSTGRPTEGTPCLVRQLVNNLVRYTRCRFLGVPCPPRSRSPTSSRPSSPRTPTRPTASCGRAPP
ncbi:alpha/beta fold hydrolase [Streptomyces griseoaurantiacus]|uniref:alpha/beta fold hydrolase n=1 Tax=Streptomyces griseoaurantiacus TaxID=68213 RepID=UPI002E2C89F4|nr:alpha/beta hydrolase [Streptomyces jietaisiensis]